MGRFPEIELDPLNLCNGPNMFSTAIKLLKNNPDKILPIYMEDPETGKFLGSYSLWFYSNKGMLFLIAENFDPPEFEQDYLIGREGRWQRVQPGIYQIEIVKSQTHQ